MKELANYVLCARFMSTMGHMLALLLLALTYKSNVDVSLSDSASAGDREEEEDKCLILIIFGLFCVMWDMIGTICGFSIFFAYVNMLQICFHFVGGVLVSRFISESWSSSALLPLVLTCSLPTTLVEVTILLSHKFLL